MILTNNQIQEILSVIESNHIIYIGANIGIDVLTDYDKKILKNRGIDIDKLQSGFTPFEQSFYFGRLSQALKDEQVRQLEYKDFLKYLNKGQYIPLSPLEEDMLSIAKQKTYGHIKGLGDKIEGEVNGIINQESRKARMDSERAIKEELERGIIDRRTKSSIMREIGKRTGDWQRDLGRIVDTEYNNIMQEGRVAQMIRENDGDVDNLKIYADVYPGACFPTKDTEYLTNEGFKYLNDIRGDELVLSFNKETNTAEWTTIVSKIKYDYDGEMHWYKNSKLDLLSTPNHNHLIGKRIRGTKEDVYENKLMPSENMRDLVLRDVMYLSVDNWNGYNEDYIELCGKKIKTEYFSRFMGWWLSDGHICFRRKRGDGSSNMTQIAITQLKEWNFEDILETFKGMFPDRNVLRIQDKFIVNLDMSYDDMSNWFLKLGHAITKYIPQEVLNLDKKYLQMFLDSFVSGDGWIEKETKGEKGNIIGGGVRMCTSSKRLADGLSEVILKCGYNPGISVRDNIGKTTYKKDGSKITTKHIRYDVRVNKNKYLKNINKYFNVIEDWKGEVGCLQLEDNYTLFIRRNGKSIWSGNCRHCIRLYLTSGIGSKPIIFPYQTLIENGTNIGRKVADWKATIGGIHPWCRCNKYRYDPDKVWDEEKGDFVLQRKDPEKRRVVRTTKNKLTVGDKVFYV